MAHRSTRNLLLYAPPDGALAHATLMSDGTFAISTLLETASKEPEMGCVIPSFEVDVQTTLLK